MNSSSETIEQVILPESVEMEAMSSSMDDVIIVENDDTVRTLDNNANDSANPTGENADNPNNVGNIDVLRLLNEIFNKKLVELSKNTSKKFLYSEERFCDLEEQLNETRKEVDKLFVRFEDSTIANDILKKQAKLEKNIVIFGVPSLPGENLMSLLLEMAEVKSVNISAKDVRKVSRIDGYRETTIVVTFDSLDVKREFLKPGKSIWLKDIPKFTSFRGRNRKISMRMDLTPHFREMWDISKAAERDGRMEAPQMTSNGLELRFFNGEIHNSIIFMGEFEAIIKKLPEPVKKSGCRRRRRQRRPARGQQSKELSGKNKKRGGRRQQRRNANHLKRMNAGILRPKLTLISFFFFSVQTL